MEPKFNLHDFSNINVTEEQRKKGEKFQHILQVLQKKTGAEVKSIALFFKDIAAVMTQKMNLMEDHNQMVLAREEWNKKVEHLVTNLLAPGNLAGWNSSEKEKTMSVLFQLTELEEKIIRINEIYDAKMKALWDSKDSFNQLGSVHVFAMFEARNKPEEFEKRHTEAKDAIEREKKAVEELEVYFKQMQDIVKQEDKLYRSLLN